MSGILILSCRLKQVINACFILFFDIKELVIFLKPNVRLRCGLDPIVAFIMEKFSDLRTFGLADLWTSGSLD